MQGHFQAYLEAKGFPPKAVAERVKEAARVERHYGDLDHHYAADRLASVIAALTYTSEDERRGRPNPSRLALNGDLRGALAAFRSAVELYGFFCCDSEEAAPQAKRAVPKAPAKPARAIWPPPAADAPLPAGA